MAAMWFVFEVRDSTLASGDNRKVGLTPSFVMLKKLSDLSGVTPPAISELGDGLYVFSFDAETSGECVCQIDAGVSLTAGSDRYISRLLSRDSSRIQSGISATGAVTLPQPPPSGYSSAGSGSIAINHNTDGTDNLRYVDQTGAGVGGASVLIYFAGDWPTNLSRVQAVATTGPDGRWLAPAFVSAGTYVAVFTIVGADGPDVSAPFTV